MNNLVINISYDTDCIVIMINTSSKDSVIKVKIDDWRLRDFSYMAVAWEAVSIWLFAVLMTL